MDFSLHDLLPSLFQFSALIVLIGVPLSLAIRQRPDLSHIPTVGSTGVLAYFDSYRFLFRARDLLQEGFDKFQGGLGAFKVASPNRWNVMLTTADLINEVKLAKSDEISILASSLEQLRAEYTLGLHEDVSEYHNQVVQSALTRNITTKFDEIHDEVVQCFEELVPADEKGWLSVPALSIIRVVVCRTANRLFLGAPMCANPEWIDLNLRFTIDVFVGASIINTFPRFVQPVIGRLFSPMPKAMRISRKFLQNEVTLRLQLDDEYGKKYDSRPNDLLSWLLDAAPAEERTVDKLIQRVLLINMAAIFTTSNTLAQSLFNLLAHPEYIVPLREEVKTVVEKYGWTKAALTEMRKLDSFMKEMSRFEGVGAVALNRRVIKPSGYTFANGLHLPYGTFIGTPIHAIHHDPGNYDDPNNFDGFRFSKIRDQDGQSMKHQMVTTKLDFLTWGYGKHACPGRFFAVTQLKTILAHILVTYDIALEEGIKPRHAWFGEFWAPDSKAKVLFRRLKE